MIPANQRATQIFKSRSNFRAAHQTRLETVPKTSLPAGSGTRTKAKHFIPKLAHNHATNKNRICKEILNYEFQNYKALKKRS